MTNDTISKHTRTCFAWDSFPVYLSSDATDGKDSNTPCNNNSLQSDAQWKLYSKTKKQYTTAATVNCNIITKFMLLIGIVSQKKWCSNYWLACYQRTVFVVRFWTWWGEEGSLAQKSLIFLREICSKLPYLVQRDPTEYHVSIISPLDFHSVMSGHCLLSLASLSGKKPRSLLNW